MAPRRGHTRPARHHGNAEHRGNTGHGAQMRHTEWTDTDGIIRMSWGECTLRATPGTLTLRAQAADEDNLRQIQDLIASRLERFGRRDQLTVTWQQPRTTA